MPKGYSQRLHKLIRDFPTYHKFLSELTEREHRVFEKRLAGCTLKELADELRITIEGVRYLERNASWKIRRRIQSEK